MWLLSGYRFSAVRADSLPKLKWQFKPATTCCFCNGGHFLNVSLWAMYDRRWTVRVLTSTEARNPCSGIILRYGVRSKSHHLQAHDICIVLGLLLLCHFSLVQRQEVDLTTAAGQNLAPLKAIKLRLGYRTTSSLCNAIS